MPVVPADYREDLDFALRLADIADHISLQRFRALDLRVETKPDLTPVSDADRAVETALRAAIAADRPTDGVVGEEYGATVAGAAPVAAPVNAMARTRPDPVRRWVIDPIDATKNYVRGVPVWATLIALLSGDEVVVGVASAPALAHRWWAARGCGSWTSRGGGTPEQNRVSKVAGMDDASLSYSELNDWGSRRRGFDTLLDRVWRTRAYGDFWSHLLVAQGAVDLSAEPELSVWDVAALVPIVEEAGGRSTGVAGGPALTGGACADGLLCSNGLLHEDAVALLRNSRGNSSGNSNRGSSGG